MIATGKTLKIMPKGAAHHERDWRLCLSVLLQLVILLPLFIHPCYAQESATVLPNPGIPQVNNISVPHPTLEIGLDISQPESVVVKYQLKNNLILDGSNPGKLKPTVSTLTNPSRVIIDIADTENLFSQEVVIEHPLVKKVRSLSSVSDPGASKTSVTSSPIQNNTRLVIECVPEASLPHTIEHEDKTSLYLITLGKAKPKNQEPKVSLIKDKGAKKNVSKDDIEERDSGRSSKKPSNLPLTPASGDDPAQSEVRKQKREAKQTEALLTGMYFQPTRDKPPLPAFCITALRLRSYRLEKLGNEYYRLTMDNTTVNQPGLLTSHFPPENFRGFQAIRAYSKPAGSQGTPNSGENNKEQIVLDIYVDTEVTLEPYRSTGELWLRARQPAGEK